MRAASKRGDSADNATPKRKNGQTACPRKSSQKRQKIPRNND
jgi:hypothetical protein